MASEMAGEVNEQKSVLSIERNPFFAPPGGVLGDTFPFFHNGVCHLFVLQPPHVAHFVSEDQIHWETRPIALQPGPADAPDAGMIATGTVVEKDGMFYMFYTGGPAQLICLATSEDLDYWTRDPRNPILVPDGKRYTHGYFRDPYVFYNEEDSAWWMLLGSRVPNRPGPRAGCVGLAKSPDLLNWELCDPLWATGIGPHHDCPQLIEHGGKWYLFYLQRNTRYRVAPSPAGPFERPAIRDIGVMYASAASRPVFDGQRWINYPFVCSLQNDDEWGFWAYGGPLCVPRELHFTHEDNIIEQPLKEVVEALRLLPAWPLGEANARSIVGDWTAEAPGQFVCRSKAGGGILLFPDVPDDFYLETEVALPTPQMEAHIILRAREDFEAGYKLAFRPGENCVDLRQISDLDIDRVMVSRPVSLALGRPIPIQIFLAGDVLEVFIDHRTSLTARVYDLHKGALILEFRDAAGTFHNLSLRQIERE